MDSPYGGISSTHNQAKTLSIVNKGSTLVDGIYRMIFAPSTLELTNTHLKPKTFYLYGLCSLLSEPMAFLVSFLALVFHG